MEEMSRLIKTQDQIKNLREAGAISAKLHLMALSQAVVGKTEIQLQQTLTEIYQHSGASAWAYPLIIGSGNRSTILHAEPSHRVISSEDLVLIDMGVKAKNFCSDITRTWPAGKKFSKEQKTIYEIVLKTQSSVIKNIKVGTTLSSLHQLTCELLKEALLNQKIIKKEDDIKNYYPHKTSHWIGSLVHDPCPYFYKEETPIDLQAGMCFTVEPGLYFSGQEPSCYSGIGVRIEDVILVTETGCEVLTPVPKEVEELEYLRALAHKK